MKMSLLQAMREHFASPDAHREMTEEEELDDDAEGGYFQQYDENGEEIED